MKLAKSCGPARRASVAACGQHLDIRHPKEWYRLLGSNQRHPAPQAGALPTELRRHARRVDRRRPIFLQVATEDKLWPPEKTGLKSPHLCASNSRLRALDRERAINDNAERHWGRWFLSDRDRNHLNEPAATHMHANLDRSLRLRLRSNKPFKGVRIHGAVWRQEVKRTGSAKSARASRKGARASRQSARTGARTCPRPAADSARARTCARRSASA